MTPGQIERGFWHWEVFFLILFRLSFDILCKFFLSHYIRIRAAHFFVKTPQTPRWNLGQNLTGHQFLATSEVVWPRVWGSECPQIRLSPTRPGTFRALDYALTFWPNVPHKVWGICPKKFNWPIVYYKANSAFKGFLDPYRPPEGSLLN